MSSNRFGDETRQRYSPYRISKIKQPDVYNVLCMWIYINPVYNIRYNVSAMTHFSPTLGCRAIQMYYWPVNPVHSVPPQTKLQVITKSTNLTLNILAILRSGAFEGVMVTVTKKKKKYFACSKYYDKPN